MRSARPGTPSGEARCKQWDRRSVCAVCQLVVCQPAKLKRGMTDHERRWAVPPVPFAPPGTTVPARSSRGGSTGATRAGPWAAPPSLAACDSGHRAPGWWASIPTRTGCAVRRRFWRRYRAVRKIGRQVASAGLIAKVVEQSGAARLFAGAHAPAARLENADGVDQHIVFANQIFDFTLRVAAAVIAAVGDDQQRFAIFLRHLHLVHGQKNRVEQRRAPLGLRPRELILDLLDVTRERHHQLRLVVELHQKKLVLGVGCPKEFSRGLTRFLQF